MNKTLKINHFHELCGLCFCKSAYHFYDTNILLLLYFFSRWVLSSPSAAISAWIQCNILLNKFFFYIVHRNTIHLMCVFITFHRPYAVIIFTMECQETKQIQHMSHFAPKRIGAVFFFFVVVAPLTSFVCWCVC